MIPFLVVLKRNRRQWNVFGGIIFFKDITCSDCVFHFVCVCVQFVKCFKIGRLNISYYCRVYEEQVYRCSLSIQFEDRVACTPAFVLSPSLQTQVRFPAGKCGQTNFPILFRVWVVVVPHTVVVTDLHNTMALATYFVMIAQCVQFSNIYIIYLQTGSKEICLIIHRKYPIYCIFAIISALIV